MEPTLLDHCNFPCEIGSIVDAGIGAKPIHGRMSMNRITKTKSVQFISNCLQVDGVQTPYTWPLL